MISDRVLVWSGVTLLCLVGLGLMHLNDKASVSSIRDHFAAAGDSAVSVERNLTVSGSPFWYENKAGGIYRVTTKSGSVWWVRTGSVLGDEYLEEPK